MAIGVFGSPLRAYAALVLTDNSAYSAGLSASIDGSAYGANEDVTLQVTYLDGSLLAGTSGDPWTVTSDNQGNFLTSWMTPMLDTVTTLLLTAVGVRTGDSAQTTFAFAPPAANLDQLRNGGPTNPLDTGAWVNGNLGSQTSHYVEAWSAGYRAVMTDMPIGDTVTLTLEYDIRHSSRNALDYLTYFDRIDDDPDGSHLSRFGHTQEVIDPTVGVSAYTGNPPSNDQFAIPVPTVNKDVNGDSEPETSFFNLTDPEDRKMHLWGGDITAISYPTPGAGEGDLTAANSSTRIEVTFVVDSPTMILAWGGHIGSRNDWDFDGATPNSAGGISGSPYHMRLIDWNLNNLGNQDRSLSADAVAAPPACSLSVDSLNVCKGTDTCVVAIAFQGVPPYSFSWTGPGVFSATNDTICFTNLGTSDDGYYVVTILDSNGLEAKCSVLVSVNLPPVASCPSGPINMFVCDLSDICIAGFSCTDAEGDPVTTTIIGGTLSNDTVCFTPIVGANVLTFICEDSCGADTCSVTVNVTLNSPPVSSCPSGPINLFVCDLSDICVPGFSCTDADGNLSSSVVSGGTLSNDTVCFTPVAGTNTIILTCTDSCGATDVCTTIVNVTLNTPPVSSCPSGPINLFVCDLSDICVPGFSCTDAEGNLASTTVSGGTLSNDTVCFTPVIGVNTIILTCTDSCGATAVCTTIVNVTLNSPPVASCPASPINLFVCDLSPICVAGFGCTDADGNLASTTVSGGTLSNDTVCFTPVVGSNTIILTCTDACGATDVCTTIVNITVNQPPVANCPSGPIDLSVCDLSPICIKGFSCADADGNLLASSVSVGTVSNDTVCFTPVPGPNPIILICVDSCGAADVCTTIVNVTVNQPPVASCPASPIDKFVCDLSPICIAGFGCTDADGNLTSTTISGGTLSNDTVCFTPVFGANNLILTCTDSCGATSVCTTTVTVTLNSAPVATCPPGDTITTNDLSPICISGFFCSDIDGNLVSPPTVNVGTISGDTVCLTPVAGENLIILTCTDSCGAVDVCTTLVFLNRYPTCNIGEADPTVTLCEPEEICFPFTSTDPDGNLFGCEVVSGAGVVIGDSLWCYTPLVNETDTVTIQCSDSLDGICEFTFVVSFIINEPPTPSCSFVSLDTSVCSLSDTLCIPGFSCSDPDGNLKTSFVNVGTLSGDTLCFTPVSGANTIILTCVDSCDVTTTCTTVVNVTLDSIPPICIAPADTTVQSIGDVPAPDTSLVTATDNCDGDPIKAFVSDSTDNQTCSQTIIRTYKVTDASGNVSFCDQIITITSANPKITIVQADSVLQGHSVCLSITSEGSTFELGGFDFMIAYDQSALTALSATPGDYIVNCGWEYFSYRFGPFGNCTGGCPSGLLKILAVAETNDGFNHPDCFGPPNNDPIELAKICFLVSNDRTLECQFARVSFFWTDCTDNVLSDRTGDVLLVSRDVFMDQNPIPITDGTTGFPTGTGIQDVCFFGLDTTKPTPNRCVDFYNGGVRIICADEIDDRGDLNLNGLANEIADVVVYTSYFIEGLAAFKISVEGQIAASDVNADGIVLSVADLVYQIRIVTGDALPIPKLTHFEKTATFSSSAGVISTDISLGAVLFTFEGEVNVDLLAGGVEMVTGIVDGNTRVLIYSMDKVEINAGALIAISDDILEIEAADYFGSALNVAFKVTPTDFALHQNYPNPFNPATKIAFDLPVSSSYVLSVYNITGQKIAEFTGVGEPGTVTVEWDASYVSSGVYFYRLEAGAYAATKKMVLLK
ncbi:MAG: T9SS type A sorting domain-containing protein [candidate division Zixibacteria bacterium]|nr:T9SS type A sorting domain-containing protein [candidate division Zixibacteria bacterium]